MIDRSAAASDKYLLHVKIEETDLIRTGYRSDKLLATSTIDLRPGRGRDGTCPLQMSNIKRK